MQARLTHSAALPALAALLVLLALAAGCAQGSAGGAKGAAPAEPPRLAAAQASSGQSGGGSSAEAAGGEGRLLTIADPLEPWNRMWFGFNDWFYRQVLDPTAKGYKTVVPTDYRLVVRNFFRNLLTPVRFVGAVLQADGEAAALELARFAANTTVGVLGMGDPAGEVMGLKRPSPEDLGQAMGKWGVGHGFYLVWPVLGPSSARDSLGMAGEYFLDPTFYLRPWEYAAGATAWRYLNDYSFSIGDYQDLTDAALDPYVAVRDFYLQYRQKKLEQ
jgi:phospholipid-binding lipoprotein MlaA